MAIKDALNTLPLPTDLVGFISEFLPARYLPSKEVLVKFSEEISPDAAVKSSTFNQADLFNVEVGLQLSDGSVRNVQCKRKFKATGDDGKTSIQGHPRRFHPACDGEGATMTVVMVQRNDGEEILLAGYNAEGWLARKDSYHIAEINPANQTLNVKRWKERVLNQIL